MKTLLGRISIGPFAAHMLVAAAVVIVFYLALLPFGIKISLGLWAVVALSLSALIYVFRFGPEPAEPTGWVDHIPVGEARRFQSDLATRRLSDMVVGAQPGRGFSNNQLALVLYDLAADRLVREHGADPDDPLITGRTTLSPALAKYLSTVGEKDSPSLSRRALHRHLKEIESL